MPAFTPRTNSIACGITSCSFIASWPAPLGMRNTGRPARPPPAPSAAARPARWARRRRAASPRAESGRPRRSQIAFSSASTSAAQASRTSSVVARMSRLNWQRPGTTLIEPPGTCSMPIVATTSGTAARALSRIERQLGHGGAASRRRSIGVVPAWLAMPMISPTIAHAAIDRGHDAERQVEFVQHRPLLDVHLDEAEVVAPGRAAAPRSSPVCRAGRRRASRRAWSRRRRRAGPARPHRTGRSARLSRGRWPCSAGLPLRRSRPPRCRMAGAGRRGAARARRPSARGCRAGRRTCRRCAPCRSG